MRKALVDSEVRRLRQQWIHTYRRRRRQHTSRCRARGQCMRLWFRHIRAVYSTHDALARTTNLPSDVEGLLEAAENKLIALELRLTVLDASPPSAAVEPQTTNAGKL